jgi:predicted metal-dependent hydrolase
LLSNFLENLQLTLFGSRKRETPSFLPKEIAFRTFEKRMFIDYQWAKHATKLREVGNTLSITGNLHRTEVKRVLNAWISKQAKHHFIPELERLSEVTGLKYETVRFKNTKTRWGSCSEKKAINLNIQLLFLPKHLSHQVLLHELCHLKYLNHSRDFWNLVHSFEPHYKKLERELKHDGRKYIPGWVLRK